MNNLDSPAVIDKLIQSCLFVGVQSFIGNVCEGDKHTFDLSYSSCIFNPLGQHMFTIVLFILPVSFTKYLDEVLHFFADHLFVDQIDHIFHPHENRKFTDVAVQPDVIDLLGEFVLVGVQIPSLEGLLGIDGLFLILIETC